MLSAILLAAVCWNTVTNECRAYAPQIGITCPGLPWTLRTGLDACPQTAPTPTPTPTATPTATPTPLPISYAITEFLAPADIGFTYVQWMSMMDDVVWGNGGVCCPGIGTGPGECIFSIDYTTNPPTFRKWLCTYADSTELWEIALPQVAHSDEYRWVVAGLLTHRPAVAAFQGLFKEGPVWAFGLPSLTVNGFGRSNLRENVIRFPHWLFFPQGILDLGGARWLYASVWSYDSAESGLGRWFWPSAYSIAWWSSDTIITHSVPDMWGIVIDADGSLIGATGTLQNNLVVDVWRSRDEGRTWAKTGIRFEPPLGRTLFQCGWEHKSGGAAVQPWHLICVLGDGNGPETGGWHAASIRVNGAKVPALWGKKPTQWKASTP